MNRLDIPIAKNPCPIDFSTKREQAKGIVRYLNSLYPGTADNMLNAVKTADTYNLWNKDWNF